jgi:hypothetical protein
MDWKRDNAGNRARIEKLAAALGMKGKPWQDVDLRHVARGEKERGTTPPAATAEERARQAARRREADERGDKRRAG